jgi:uncharacterized membrane protein YfcA
VELSFASYVLVFSLVFLGGFVDSAAGGGGLISLPAYYLAGLSPAYAAGSNKLSAFAGTFTATLKYANSKQIKWNVATVALGASFIGSFFGAELFKIIPEKTISIIVLVVLPIMALLILSKNKRKKEVKNAKNTKYSILLAIIIGLCTGIYDGLIGPGTGTILQLLFANVMGFNALLASGSARLVNLGSNIGALISLISQGRIIYTLSIPAALFGVMGNWLGANLALKKGERFIQGLIIVVLCLLAFKTIYDLTQGGV